SAGSLSSLSDIFSGDLTDLTDDERIGDGSHVVEPSPVGRPDYARRDGPRERLHCYHGDRRRVVQIDDIPDHRAAAVEAFVKAAIVVAGNERLARPQRHPGNLGLLHGDEGEQGRRVNGIRLAVFGDPRPALLVHKGPAAIVVWRITPGLVGHPGGAPDGVDVPVTLAI